MREWLKKLRCYKCKSPIGYEDGRVVAYENYQVCKECGGEYCNEHCRHGLCVDCEEEIEQEIDKVGKVYA